VENIDKFDRKKKLLLRKLINSGYLRDKRLIKAFMDVPLEDFIPEEFREPFKLYEDIPNLFYFSNPENYRTISAPHMISIMLQGLALEEKDDLLILGAKSGYIATLAHKLAPKGEIIILEANSEIAKITSKNLRKMNLQNSISVIVKNPLEGMPELSPWQKILVTGAIQQDRIYPLLKQLDSSEGVLYAPIGGDFIQVYTQILRINNDFFGKKQLQVRFTPLMTQVELDELELVTDVEKIQVKEDPQIVDNKLNKIHIKYASNIIDEIDLEPAIESQTIDRGKRDLAIQMLKKINKSVKDLKNKDDIISSFKCIDDIEEEIENLKELKKIFDIKIKKIQNIINQIRTFNIIRKELEKKSVSDQNAINKKIEIINFQLNEINYLKELLDAEIRRLSKL